MSDSRRRALVLVLAVAVVAGAAAVDAAIARPRPSATLVAPASAVVAGHGASSSAWYCAAAAATPGGYQANVLLTNPTARAVTGTLTERITGSAGSQAVGFSVPATGQLALPLAAAGASTVVVAGGGVAASEIVSGPLGWSNAPCTSTTSTQWYFAHASTSPGRATQLVLYNPTASDAVVNITFVSAANGVVAPPGYQGLPVPAGGVVVENVGDHLQKDESFGTEVAALSGSVVAAEAAEAGAPGNGGISLMAGVAAPTRTWAFARNYGPATGGNNFYVFNPGGAQATVTVSVGLAEGQAAPIVLHVPGAAVASLATEGLTRIPVGAVFGLTFTSSGPGIVVTRESYVPAGPMPTFGYVVGSPGGQRHWLVAPASAPATAPFGLAVVDLSGRAVHVTVATRGPSGALAPLAGAARVTLVPGSLLQLGPGPGAPIGTAPLELDADGPIAVELDAQPTGASGAAVLAAWPLVSPGG